MRGHVEGLFLTYGNTETLMANANFRGYDVHRQGYRQNCMLAAMSPTNLGNIVWIRPKYHTEWFGPCLVVDTVSRVDWYHSVHVLQDIGEIPRWLMNKWGSEFNGLPGEAYYGLCPPGDSSRPIRYLPDTFIDPFRPVVRYSRWPYPEQQFPVECP